jgi:hypothetical protein
MLLRFYNDRTAIVHTTSFVQTTSESCQNSSATSATPALAASPKVMATLPKAHNHHRIVTDYHANSAATTIESFLPLQENQIGPFWQLSQLRDSDSY